MRIITGSASLRGTVSSHDATRFNSRLLPSLEAPPAVLRHLATESWGLTAFGALDKMLFDTPQPAISD